jgi:hypothetical protein
LGGYKPPGFKKGRIIQYNLQLTSTVSGNDHKRLLAGTWTKDSTLGELSGDMSLSGWKVYRMGVNKRKYENKTIIDYGARPISETFETVSKLKRYMSVQEKSRNRDNGDVSRRCIRLG